MKDLFDKLTPLKKKFLYSLGITENNISSDFFNVIESYDTAFSESERFILDGSDWLSELKQFSMKDIVGTAHGGYSNKTWFEAFANSKRGDELIEKYFNNPKYYEELKNLDQSKLLHDTQIGLVNKEGKYYIIPPDGGNNRMLLMKIKYLALINKANGNQEEIDMINRQFTFIGKVKYLPKKSETSEMIYSLNFLLGAYKRKVRQISNDSNNLLFRIETDQKIYEAIDEDELPNIYNDIITTYDPKETEKFYDLYNIEIGDQESSRSR